MARKLRALTLADLPCLPAGCAGCVFWETGGAEADACGEACNEDTQRAWYLRVTDEWGECGRVAYEDDEIIGVIKYAPSAFFPRAQTLAVAPDDPRVPLIACLHISADARHHGLGSVMLRAALRDLSMRGERRVEAFAAAHKPAVLDESPFLGLEFLLRNGFTVSKPDPNFPLLKLDLRSLAMLQENLEAVLESLRFPARTPRRVPASWIEGR